MDGVLGEIRYFGFAFAPRNFKPCDGRLLNIRENQALFALLGITFGGDGKTTFGLPDLRGRAIIGSSSLGSAGGYPTGTMVGQENVTLLIANVPAHTHDVRASIQEGTSAVGKDRLPSKVGKFQTYEPVPIYSTNNTSTKTLNSETVSVVGGGSHRNMQPFAVVEYCICTSGFFPSRE